MDEGSKDNKMSLSDSKAEDKQPEPENKEAKAEVKQPEAENIAINADEGFKEQKEQAPVTEVMMQNKASVMRVKVA